MVNSLPGEMWCKMVKISTTHCGTMVNSPTGHSVMPDGQKFNNTMQDSGWLTNWTKYHVRWSVSEQHLARGWLTNRLHEISCQMVTNSTTSYDMMVNSPAGWNVMWNGHKFNKILQGNGWLTNWIKGHARWSEIQQCLVWQQPTHQLDEMPCKMFTNSTIPCKTMVDSLPGWNVM